MSVGGGRGLEEVFRSDYARLVASLSVAGGWRAAEDAVQEAFVRASVRWWRISRYDQPSAWIRRVAINVLLDTIRKDSRRKQAEGIHGADQQPERHVDQVLLMDALAPLTPRQRVFVVCHYVLDMPLREIAQVAGVSDGTVKSTLHDARKLLAREFSDDEP